MFKAVTLPSTVFGVITTHTLIFCFISGAQETGSAWSKRDGVWEVPQSRVSRRQKREKVKCTKDTQTRKLKVSLC